MVKISIWNPQKIPKRSMRAAVVATSLLLVFSVGILTACSKNKASPLEAQLIFETKFSGASHSRLLVDKGKGALSMPGNAGVIRAITPSDPLKVTALTGEVLDAAITQGWEFEVGEDPPRAHKTIDGKRARMRVYPSAVGDEVVINVAWGN
jgi:hypothetical protein